MKVIKEKHPLVMRWTHWVNFPILTIMIWSGLLIYWGNDVYHITLFGHKFVQFFPAWFYKLLNIPFRLAEGMAFHFLFMWIFFVNGFLYVIYTIFSGEWRALVPNRHSFKEALLVVLHDLHIRRSAPPQDKYNAAQRIAYSAIIVMGFGSVVTGLAIYKPVQLYWLCWLCGGYHLARIFHFALTIGYVLFFVIHIVQVILAGWNNFRSVIAGFEILKVPAPAVPITELEPPVPPSNTDNVPNVDNEPTVDNVPDFVSVPKARKAPTVEQKIRRRDFISFTTFAVVGSAAFGGWKWLYNSSPEIPGVTAGARKPLRRALNQTELFFRNTFSNKHLVETYPKSMAARRPRVNSVIGMTEDPFAPETWQLTVDKGGGDILKIGIDDIKALPKTEIVYDFKCVEGWDEIQHWAGVKFSDFVAHYQLGEQAKLPYVGMETPNGKYYVGLDIESVMHPQTLLAYELNDRLLALNHGAPLRLIVPVKYGIKNLKRIGTIRFSQDRPRDYWAEQGYDYYSGL